MAAHQAPLSLGFFRQERWSGLPFPFPMHESEKWKVKSESEVAQSCPTLSDCMDCSLQGSSIHGIFQARNGKGFKWNNSFSPHRDQQREDAIHSLFLISERELKPLWGKNGGKESTPIETSFGNKETVRWLPSLPYSFLLPPLSIHISREELQNHGSNIRRLVLS